LRLELGCHYLPDPLKGIVWFAFDALSKTVTAEAGCGPVPAGVKTTLNLHFFFGKSCAPQVVPPAGNANIGEFVTVAGGLPKTIGGPLLAGLLRVNVCFFTLPTFTLPKFFIGGVIFKTPAPWVGVAVGVGVAVEVAVAVAVGVAPPGTFNDTVSIAKSLQSPVQLRAGDTNCSKVQQYPPVVVLGLFHRYG